MKEYLISQFIDNELNLDEKIEFVDTVHHSHDFTREAMELIEQEKIVGNELSQWVPRSVPQVKSSLSWPDWFRLWWQPFAGFAAAMFLVAIISPYYINKPQKIVQIEQVAEYRFVVYLPEINQAEIIGTFTGWAPLPMEQIGATGYWTLTLDVPAGEHRYSYMVENGTMMADPSITTREKDDFGGENSVIRVGAGYDPLS